MFRLHTSFGRRVLEGIVGYLERDGENSRSRWQILTGDWGDVGMAEVTAGAVDGVIATVTELTVLEAIQTRAVPCVNLADHPHGLLLPSVVNDVAAAAALASRHLLDRRIDTLGLVVARQDSTAAAIIQAYRALAGDHTLAVHEARLVWADRRNQEWVALCSWLKSLQFPAGVFAVNDILARRVLQACRHLQIRVPDEVAVLGCGDYELVNRLATPSLSSVLQASYEVGYQSMELLENLLENPDAGARRHLIAPAGVVARRSTDVRAVEEPTVQAALEFIHSHLGRGLKVSDVAAQVAVSRRWLERKFMESLGRSPAAEIRRAQIEQASRLLSDTDWSLAVVARECGLKAPERLSVLFKKETGMTPGRYRTSVRGVG